MPEIPGRPKRIQTAPVRVETYETMHAALEAEAKEARAAAKADTKTEESR